jgi:hypothetical protein
MHYLYSARPVHPRFTRFVLHIDSYCRWAAWASLGSIITKRQGPGRSEVPHDTVPRRRILARALSGNTAPNFALVSASP